MPGCDAHKFQDNLEPLNDDNYRQLSVIRTCPDSMNFLVDKAWVESVMAVVSTQLACCYNWNRSVWYFPRRSSQVHLITLSSLLVLPADSKLYWFPLAFNSWALMRTIDACAHVSSLKQLKRCLCQFQLCTTTSEKLSKHKKYRENGVDKRGN